MYEKLTYDEFFIIDSNNLKLVQQKLYGYILQDKDVIFNINENEDINENGTYIYIEVDDSNIKISQDYNGSYGLYLYKSDDYFAISNSFLKLVEYLKDKQPLSFNRDFADAFLFTSLCTFSYGETLVNEIEVLPRDYKIIINKENKSINFEEGEYKEHTVDLDSKEGFEILDSWYYKWVNIIRSIKEKTNNLSIHLSGGFDSRIVIALMLSANIDLDKVNIFSADDGKHTHSEDYEIASEIAKEFNFELNKDVFSANLEVFDDIEIPMNISFYTKLGFHKQMYYKYFRYSEPVYSINGSAGENIKKIKTDYRLPSEEFIKRTVSIASRYHDSLMLPTQRISERSLQKLREKYPDIPSEKLPKTLYKEVRSRNHFGKGAVEEYLQNMISLSPEMDSELSKLKLSTSECVDENLLITVIFTRYCPKLLDFKFDSNRKIDEETIEYAKKLNEKYEFHKKEQEFISGPELKNNDNKKFIKKINADKLIKKVFYSNSFEKEFKKYYPSKLYNKISELIETKDYYPLTEVYSSLGILTVLNYVNKTENYNIKNWIKNLSEEETDKYKGLIASSQSLLTKYNTSRIDIENLGSKNSTIEIISTSKPSPEIKYPKWFNEEKNHGAIIQSEGNH